MRNETRVGREHDIDTLTKVRRRVCPTLHRLKQPLGGFAQCIMDSAEYVGTIEQELAQFRTDLRSMGFNREPISSLKFHDDGRASAGSWVKRPSTLAEKQLHVTLFYCESHAIDVFAHWEYSWITHPYKHYRAADWETGTGVRMMRALLAEHGIEYVVD